MISPYYFNNDSVRGVNFYHNLDIYILSEAQQFPQIAVLQQDGAPLHITPAACSLFVEMFPNSWTVNYSSSDWPGRSTEFVPLCFFLSGFVNGQSYQTSVPSLTKVK